MSEEEDYWGEADDLDQGTLGRKSFTASSSNYLEQARHADKIMTEVTEAFTKRMEAEGYIVTQFQDEVTVTKGPARLAYDKRYTGFNASGFAMFRKGFEAAAQVARDAKLPSHFRWGHNAMEQFNFGKERAAKAIMGEE
jgi:hypothetical protein